MGFYTGGSSSTFKGKSGFAKLVDILQRPNYASAGLAEYLLHRSPYKSAGAAAWGGFAGQRRTTYGKLTGEPVSGFILDVGLDPTTYISFGAIPSAVKAARIPEFIARGGVALGKKVPAVGRAASAISKAAKIGFLDPRYKAKQVLGMLSAEDRLRKLGGVSDDAIRAARGGQLTRQILKSAPKEALVDLGIIHRGAKFLEMPTAITGKRMRTVEDLRRVYKPLAKSWEQLDEEKTLSMLNALEHRAPVATEVFGGHGAGPEGWTLSQSPEFMKDLKAMGMSNDEIAAIHAKFKNPTIYDVPQLNEIESIIGPGMSKSPIINPIALADSEYNELMEAAVAKLGPEYQQMYGYAKSVLGGLADEVAGKRRMYKNIMDNFTRRLGLGYITHEPGDLKKYWRFIQKSSVEKASTLESKIATAKGSLKAALQTAEKASDATESKEIRTLLDKLDGFKDKELKEMFGGADDFGSYMKKVKATGYKIRAPELKKAYYDFERAIESTFQEMRVFAGTVGEINALSKQAGFGKVLETNLPKLLYAEEVKLQTVLLYHDYFTKMRKAFPKLIKVAGKKGDVPENFVKVTSEIMGNYVVHKDIAGLFEGILRVSSGSANELAGLSKFFNSTYSSLKYYMIVPFPKTAIRNFVSSLSLTSLSITNPADFSEWMGALGKAKSVWAGVRKGNKASIALYNEMLENGLLQGFFRAEFATTAGLDAVYPWAMGLERTKALKGYMSGLSALYDFSETVPRMAMYMFAKNKPAAWFKKFGVDGPVKLVQKFHPTYSKMTQFENKYMNKLFMFYSWPRHNIPLHIQMLANNPAHYATLEKVRRTATDVLGGAEPEYYEQEYIRGGYAVGIKAGKETKHYFLLKGWLPEADIENVLNIAKFRDMFFDMFNPLVKTPLEAARGYDLFKKQRIPRFPGEKEVFFGVKLDPRIVHLTEPIRVINETNRLFFGKNDPFLTRVMFALVGKTYTVDVPKAKRYFKYHAGVVMGELDKGIERAKKEKDYKTVKRLMENKRKIEQSVKGL